MVERGWLEQLRALLSRSPSYGAWSALVRHMEEAPEGELGVGLEYAWGHLQGWPRRCCAMPSDWLERPGRTLPRALPLCRSWDIEGSARGALLEYAVREVQRFSWARLESLSLNGAFVPAGELRRLLGSAQGRSIWQVSAITDMEDETGDGLYELLGAVEGLRGLSLSLTQPRRARLLGMASWARLEELGLTQTSMDGASLASLVGGAPALRSLDLGANFLEAADLDEVLGVASSSLASLRLNHNRISWSGGILRGRGGPRLRALSLADNPMGDGGVGALARTAWLAGLEELDLTRVEAGEAGMRALAAAPWSGLRRLALSQNPVGDAGVEALARAGWLRGIEELLLSGVGCGGQGLRALLEGGGLDEVRELRLGGNRLGAEGICALAQAPGLGGLRRLSLSGFDAASVEALIGAVWRSGLEELDVAQSKEPAAMLRLMEGLASAFPSLRELDVSWCELGDEHVVALAHSGLPLRLEVLNLTGNAISEVGGRVLADSVRGRRDVVVYLGGNAMEYAVAKELEEALAG